jgi:hypothetical protein
MAVGEPTLGSEHISLSKRAEQAIPPRTIEEKLLSNRSPISFGAPDLVFCDSITISIVRSRRKVLYRLIGAQCLEHIAATLSQH